MKLATILSNFAVFAQENEGNEIGRFGGRPLNALSQDLIGQGGPGLGRRYSDLLKIVQHYTPDFDERKYWAYGCNCLILGDRPMSDPGFGRPVDPLDAICKQYKDCQKCVKQQFGEQCIGEFVKYRWQVKSGEVTCRDQPGTCERNLCECDKDFARKMPTQYDVFDKDYHLFWSTIDWNPQEDSCLRGRGISEPECCGPPTGPMVIYNSLNKECCDDFTVQSYGMC